MENEKVMKKGKSKLSAMARMNSLGMICHSAEIAVILIAYFLEFVKGNRTFPYIVAVALVGIASPVIEYLLYKADKEHAAIKHVIGTGFMLFYLFVLFTSDNRLVFVYVMPMIIVITVFNDVRYSLLVNAASIVINFAHVNYCFISGKYTSADMAAAEIQVLVVIIIAVFCALVSNVTRKNTDEQFNIIKEQGEKSEQILADTLQVSNGMVSTINIVDDMISELDTAISNTKDAMGEVDSGSTDTTEAVQKQLVLTENIQTKITEVEGGTGEIIDGVRSTNEAVRIGKENVDTLVSKGNESMASGKKVEDELISLKADMEGLNSVIDIINNIASQTELLSFNASIEAARAGETGRGFAVVASEISKMAKETEVATAQITEKLFNMSEAINRVVEVANNMIEVIISQNEATQETAKSFETIAENTMGISGTSESLAGIVKDLALSNKEIVDSITTISSISEEVASHANQTFAVSENNMDTVKELVTHIDELKELAASLQ